MLIMINDDRINMKRDDVRIIRIILDLHGVIVDSRKVVLFEYSEHCHALCSYCFHILDHASTSFQLKIKEAFHIQREQPSSSQQLHHVLIKKILNILIILPLSPFIKNSIFSTYYQFNFQRFVYYLSTEDDRSVCRNMSFKLKGFVVF